MAAGRVFILSLFLTAVADDSASLTNDTQLQVLDEAEQPAIYSEDPKVQVAAEALASLNAANCIKEGLDEALKDLADIKESIERQRHQQADLYQAQMQQLQRGQQVQWSEQWPGQPSSQPMLQPQELQQVQQPQNAGPAAEPPLLQTTRSAGESGYQSQWSSQQWPPLQPMQQPQYAGQPAGCAGQGVQQPDLPSQWLQQQSPQQFKMEQAPLLQTTRSAGESGYQSQWSSQQWPPLQPMQQPQYAGQPASFAGQGVQQPDLPSQWLQQQSSSQPGPPFQPMQQPQYVLQPSGGLPESYQAQHSQYTVPAAGSAGQFGQQPQTFFAQPYQPQQMPSAQQQPATIATTMHPNYQAQSQHNQVHLQAHAKAQQQAQEWQKSQNEMINRAQNQAEVIYQAAPASVRRCAANADVLHDMSYLQ